MCWDRGYGRKAYHSSISKSCLSVNCLLIVSSMCVIYRGYTERLKSVMRLVSNHNDKQSNSKLLLSGNYVTGVSIHDCIANSKEQLIQEQLI